MRGVQFGSECRTAAYLGRQREMDLTHGRGWAVLEGDELHGMIFIHGGDDLEFVAKKKGRRRAK